MYHMSYIHLFISHLNLSGKKSSKMQKIITKFLKDKRNRPVFKILLHLYSIKSSYLSCLYRAHQISVLTIVNCLSFILQHRYWVTWSFEINRICNLNVYILQHLNEFESTKWKFLEKMFAFLLCFVNMLLSTDLAVQKIRQLRIVKTYGAIVGWFPGFRCSLDLVTSCVPAENVFKSK